jgi:hypothetical protein
VTLREIVTRIGFNVDTRSLNIYDKAIGRILEQARELQRGLTHAADAIGDLGKKLFIGVSAPLAIIATTSTLAAAKVEDMRKEWEVLIGTAPEGKAFVDAIAGMEDAVPFEREELLQYAKSLRSLGIEQEDVLPSLQKFADISSGSGLPMEQMITRFSMMKNMAKELGYIMGRDVNQLVRRGILDRKQLRTLLGVEDIKKIPNQVKMTEKGVERLMDTLGQKYMGAAARRSDTLKKAYGNLIDSLFDLRAEFGASIVSTFHLKEITLKLINVLNNLRDRWKKLSPEAKKLIFVFGAIAFAIGPLLLALKGLLVLLISLRTAMAFLSLAGIAGGIGKLIPLLLKMSGVLLTISLQIALWAVALALVFLLVEDIVGFFTGKNSLIIPMYIEAWKEFLTWYQGWGDKLYGWWKSGADTITSYWRKAWESFFQWYTGNPIVKFFMGVGAKMAQQDREAEARNPGLAKTPYGSVDQILGIDRQGVPPPPPGYSPSLKQGGQGIQISVNTGDLTIGVPEGTSAEQKRALSSSASEIIKTAFMDEVTKNLTKDLQSVTRR